MNIKSSKGFTLVEVVVTLVVLAILAGIVFSIYFTQAREVAISSAYAEVNRGYDIFLEQLGQDVRFANSITATASGIAIFDNNGDQIATYSIPSEGNSLLYNGTPFSTGAGNVLLINTSASYFTITNLNKTVSSNLTLTGNDGRANFELPIREDVFKCRN